MIRIDRPPAPEWFQNSLLRQHQIGRIRAWFDKPRNKRGLKAIGARWANEIPGFMKALREVFYDKCAFCETKLNKEKGDDAFLAFFRPTEDALQLDGRSDPDHYLWLSWEWSNLYLACRTCIDRKDRRFPTRRRRARPNSFHTALVQEAPYLLDPCVDDPFEHLQFEETGQIAPYAGSERGTVTIELLDLNRPELVSTRCATAETIKDSLQACLASDRGVGADLIGPINHLVHACRPASPFAGLSRQLLMRWLELVVPATHNIRSVLPAIRRCLSELPANVEQGFDAETREPACEELLLGYLGFARESLKATFVHRAFLSIDLVEATKMKIGQDPVIVKYSFEKYYSFLDAILNEHSSDQITRAGDGSMSSYRQTQDAVNAAIAFHEKLSKFNLEQNKLPMPFMPRCGIHCGDVPGSVQIPNIFSVVIDISGHLQKYCEPGGLLISDDGYREISNKEDFEKFPQEVDGQQVWRYKCVKTTAMPTSRRDS